MRRADAIWLYDQTAKTFTDVTLSLGAGAASVAFAPNQTLYVAASDWLSGLILLTHQNPGPTSVVTETFDGIADAWRPLPLQERVNQLSAGATLQAAGYDFSSSGMIAWGESPYLWTRRLATSPFPESPPAPSELEAYWVRLRNTGATTIGIDRLVPAFYNTYLTHQELSAFLGVEEFDDVHAPSATMARRAIRAAEDWLDYRTRRAWRPRQVLSERHQLNPYGTSLKRYPVLLVTRCALWSYDTTTTLNEGRGQDFFVSHDANQLMFNPSVLYLAPYGRLNSAIYQQREPLEVDYIYGEDFDLSERRGYVQEAIWKHVAADLIMQSDWSSVFLGNPEFSKESKAEAYRTQALEIADDLQRMVMA